MATIHRLADALDVTVAFLAADEIDSLRPDSVSFRKLSKTSAAQRDAALATGRIAIEICSWIEQRFVLPATDLPTLEKHDPKTAARISGSVGDSASCRSQICCTCWRRTVFGSSH